MNKVILSALIGIVAVGAVAYAGWYLWVASLSSPPATPLSSLAVPIKNPFGVVASTTADSFTILAMNNKIITIYVTHQTQFLKATTTQSFSDVQPGRIVSITLSTPQGDGSLLASQIHILPPLLQPTVRSGL